MGQPTHLDPTALPGDEALFQRILGEVQRPQRYIGGEWNLGAGSFRYQTAADYIDGDQTVDLVVNALGEGRNEVRIGYNFEPSTESFSSVVDFEHPEEDAEWGLAELYTGDVNGDGADDLVWLIERFDDYRVYVALRVID